MSDINKDIIEALELGDVESFKTLCDQKMFTLRDNIFKNTSRSLMHEEEEPDATAVQNTTDDPTLDPGMEREYFLNSFEVGDVAITIKTIGVGRNKPVSVYLDDNRWEMFPGPIKAEKEATEFVQSDRYEKWKERKGLNNQPEPEGTEEEEGPGAAADEEKEEEPNSKEDKASSNKKPPVPKEKKSKKKPPANKKGKVKKKKKTKNESVLDNLKWTLKCGKPQRVIFENNE